MGNVVVVVASALLVAVLLCGYVCVACVKETTTESRFEYGNTPRIVAHIGTDVLATATLKDRIIGAAREFATSKTYVADVYDCTEYSRDLGELLRREFGIRSRVIEHRVNCTHGMWDYDNCVYFDGMHDFLYVYMPDGKNFYMEATAGFEITEELYPAYLLT